MTPESLIGAFELLDRWTLLVADLSGAPRPPLPDLPGHMHQCTDTEADPHAAAWDQRTAPPAPIEIKEDTHREHP